MYWIFFLAVECNLLTFFLGEFESTSNLSFHHYSKGGLLNVANPPPTSFILVLKRSCFWQLVLELQSLYMHDILDLDLVNNTCTLAVQMPGFGCVSGIWYLKLILVGGGGIACTMVDRDPIPPVVPAAWAGSRNSPAFGMLCNMVPLLCVLHKMVW